MQEPSTQDNLERGLARLERLAGEFDESRLEAAAEASEADRVCDQPWLVAGVSDGMGLRVVLAALQAGLLDQGVGVYWEPPTLLEWDEDGPVSPIHYARYQNALALEQFAERYGAELEVLSSDVVLAPQRGIKGDVKEEPPEFPDDVAEAFRRARRASPKEDAVFIDSVAFGKWICPREGMEPVDVPSVDEQGRIVTMSTKKYHPRGYQETLDTMGRNHGRLLDAFRERGWFGPDTVSAFFTWAGGSQNVEVLEGIYGRGSLGDAKIIAESDVAEFRLEHGQELGEHAIVRFPAFLSSALMAIPGGGLFGLVSRNVLQDHGVHRSIPELAARMLGRLFGSEWVRRNPIAQLELDSNEALHMSEISSKVGRAHERIEKYRDEQGVENEPIPVEKSAEILDGLVPWNYRQILGRFRPGVDEEVGSAFRVEQPVFSDWVEAPVAATVAGAAGELDDALGDALDDAEWLCEELTFGRVAPGDVESFVGAVSSENGRVEREIADGDDRRVARSTVETGRAPESALEDWPADGIGEPSGRRFPIEEGPAAQLSVEPGSGQRLDEAAALVALAEASLRHLGRVGPSLESAEWSARIDSTPEPGDQLVTYSTNMADGEITAYVVDDDGKIWAELTLVER